MPRDGPDNGPFETGKDQVHGASGDASLQRTQKVAPLPEADKGFAIEGLNASGGGSSGIGTGQGGHAQDSNKPPVVDEVTKKS